MPDSKEKANEKISRLIRKEVAIAVLPLLETVAALKKEVALLKKADRTAVPAIAEEPALPAPDKEKKLCIGREDIAKLRKRLKLSRRKFAVLFDVSREEISAWESGKSEPAQNQRQQLARIMAMNKQQRTALLESPAAEPK
ncbi:MAG: helix-turn-helix transcriptional regulator [Lentisphaeria bacterium]|nr:helix-turn-helix transcriptional regulator [Lentisphaeria bacterium]